VTPADRTHSAGTTKASGWLPGLIYSIAIPILILAALEGGLRLAGYGYPTGFFAQTQKSGKPFLINNRFFGRRFFPESLLREAEPLSFPKRKAEGYRRIFVVGSSAAQGDPEPAFGFSRILDIMLQRCYPGRRFEIINTAMTAINSHVALPIVKDCAGAQPDLFIVFMGNNEVVGPFGAGTMLTPFFADINLIRAGIAVQSTRIGQMLAAIQRRVSRTATVPESWGGMEMFLENQVGSESPALAKVYTNFRRNLADICRQAAAAGAEVILCTVPVNLKDSAPFASLHSEGRSAAEVLAWDSLYQSGVGLERANTLDSALAWYTAAMERDSLFADVHFRMARGLWELGAFDRAKACFQRAREQDALRFRATKQINAIIRETGCAAELPVHLADLERGIEEISPHKIPGRELFYDHVHLNFTGNYRAACSLFSIIEKILQKQNGEKALPLPSEEQCAHMLAFSNWDNYQISQAMLERFEKPPFSNQLYHAERMTLLTQENRDLKATLTPTYLDSAVALDRAALLHNPDDWRLRFKFCILLQDRQQYAEAIEHYRVIENQMPHISRVYGNMGVALAHVGLHAEAISRYRQALQINPRDITTLNSLGVELVKSGHTAEATDCFQKALRLSPQYLSAHLNFANLLSEQKKFAEANLHFDRALSLDSGHATTYMNYGASFLRQQKPHEAQVFFRRALALDSNFVPAYLGMGSVLIDQGDLKGALDHYRRVLTIDSNNTTARRNLFAINKMLDQSSSRPAP
jgi:tetratricopeptide (TPR) repeat protein